MPTQANEFPYNRLVKAERHSEDSVNSTQAKAKVILFRESGKYYTEEEWTIPANAIGPYDMRESVDFRRIGNGAVLVETQEPWGYPCLIPFHD